MVRPSDLPKPVRDHEPHENTQIRMKQEASPGPARYSGQGLTTFDRDSRLGFFPRSKRFSDSPSRGEDQHPGPKYSPSLNSTKISIGFSNTSHLSSSPRSTSKSAVRSASCPLVPSPGDYHTELPWSKGVTLPMAGRPRESVKNSTPGPGDYSPYKPPKRDRAARIAAASSPQKPSQAAALEGPKHTSLRAMDEALAFTRPHTCGVSFPKSGRSTAASSSRETIDNLPHAYDVDKADTVTRPNLRGGQFSKSSRLKEHRPDTDGRLVALPDPNLDSNRTTVPRISFAKSKYSRGIPDRSIEKNEIPTAKYYPTMDAVSRGVRGVVAWGKPPPPRRTASGGKDAGYAAGVQYIESKSTLGGPNYSFGTSKRPAPYPAAQAPVGPGSYNPSPIPRRTTPAVGFTKAKRDGLEAVQKEHRGESEGPMYNPNYFVGHPSQSSVSISRAPRQLKLGEASSGPDAMYDPQFTQTSPNSRAGVLYLTG